LILVWLAVGLLGVSLAAWLRPRLAVTVFLGAKPRWQVERVPRFAWLGLVEEYGERWSISAGTLRTLWFWRECPVCCAAGRDFRFTCRCGARPGNVFLAGSR
jgi:hypothetical protein